MPMSSSNLPTEIKGNECIVRFNTEAFAPKQCLMKEIETEAREYPEMILEKEDFGRGVLIISVKDAASAIGYAMVELVTRVSRCIKASV